MVILSDRKAVVTGGAKGIGRCIAESLARAGAGVHVLDLEPGESSNMEYHKVDISDTADVARALDELPPDISLLVNNAGITRDRTLVKMSDDEWRSVLDTNLSGAFHMIRALAPRMAERGVGRIVNITSINALRGKFGQSNYTSAKAGMIGLTKTAARELGPKGITVNAVAPGMVLTDMARELPEDILARARSETVLGKLTTPEDVADAVLFLLSDAAKMITGEVLRVDAGQYI